MNMAHSVVGEADLDGQGWTQKWCSNLIGQRKFLKCLIAVSLVEEMAGRRQGGFCKQLFQIGFTKEIERERMTADKDKWRGVQVSACVTRDITTG